MSYSRPDVEGRKTRINPATIIQQNASLSSDLATSMHARSLTGNWLVQMRLSVSHGVASGNKNDPFQFILFSFALGETDLILILIGHPFVLRDQLLTESFLNCLPGRRTDEGRAVC